MRFDQVIQALTDRWALRFSKPNALRVSVSISRKLNLGRYESADVMLSLSGIEPGTTTAEIEAALATGALGYSAVKSALAVKVGELRRERQE